MLPTTLIKGFDKKRLRNLLLVFFLALALPTAALIWQAYSQLKWESFHQYRGDAEELTRRINASVDERAAAADSRSFADYSFLVVAGDPSANFVQRSPLSTFPVGGELPGLIGYFQVDSDGSFSTPLLPAEDTDGARLGISQAELQQRSQLGQTIRMVLADNELVRSRPEFGFAGVANKVQSTGQSGSLRGHEEGGKEGYEASGQESALEERAQSPADLASDTPASEQLADDRQGIAAGVPASLGVSPGVSARTEQPTIASSSDADDAKNNVESRDELSADKDAAGSRTDKLAQEGVQSNEAYSQQVFDRLNTPKKASKARARAAEEDQVDAVVTGAEASEPEAKALGKVSAIKLDAELQKKSERAERELASKGEAKQDAYRQRKVSEPSPLPARSKRKEQITLPESAATPPALLEDMTASEGDVSAANAVAGGRRDLRINTFESEIDPFEFSLLDSGHAVLFRKVWRNDERFIQGALLDRQQLLDALVGENFANTALSDVSELIVAYEDDVIHSFSGRERKSYSAGDATLDGALLYRSRLSAPLDSLELIYSVTRLPAGPGAGVLAWVTLVLGLVFVSGFAVLYRLGLSQITLAQQQQDFVSAVSHELKTPLTSIRMYGEMLKEGWAEEGKRQGYYEFIHDESERLSRLISNVLQLANITHNSPEYDLKPTEVGVLMSHVNSKIASQVERAGFELRITRGPEVDMATINIDEDCFAQIIINLVDNAIKFSRNAEQKIIEISSQQSGDSKITFSVRDYGPGIPKDQMKKIFNIFYRAESELTRETVGTGIGLAIVHQLTTAMQGKVDLINKVPGAEFRLTFLVN